MSEIKKEWEELKKSFGAFSEKSVSYKGTCPHCDEESEFYKSAIRNLKNPELWAKSAGLLLDNPLNFFKKQLQSDHADFGFCVKCEKQTQQCPRCKRINPYEYNDATCIGCGKKYISS